jgi:hypothetical protein
VIGIITMVGVIGAITGIAVIGAIFSVGSGDTVGVLRPTFRYRVAAGRRAIPL